MKPSGQVDIPHGIVDAVGVGVAVYGEDGRYCDVNRAYAEMIEADREAVVGTPIWEINADFDPERFHAYWDSFAPDESRYAELVLEFDSTTIQVSSVTTRTTIGEQPYHVETVREITPANEREQQLERLHSVTRNLMNAESREEIALRAARTAETILGYESSVLRFRVGDELHPVAVTEQAREGMGDRPVYPVDGDTPVALAYRSGEPKLFDDVQTLEDEYDRGEARTVMYLPIGHHGVLSVASSTAGAYNQGDVYLASILTANTETALTRLENERRLEHKNARLEAFYDVITHDIPNHLHVAETRLALASQGESADHLGAVSKAHGRIQEIIDDMHALVRQGDRIEETEWVPFDSIARRCWDRCRPEDSTASLVLESADGLEGRLDADRSRFKQLLENLFWNALDHAGDGATLYAGLTEDGFYVEDDGPGIPEADREQILAPGFTTTDDHSGFGLAIVNEIARAHGWFISVAAGLDCGARFEISGVTVK